jgi:hypothetical protein
MRIAAVKIEGAAPYSASKVIDPEEVPKLAKEGYDDYEQRTWRYRLHEENGQAFIPAMAFKLALDEAAKRFAGKIQGQGNATWKKYFEAGVLVGAHLPLPGVTRDGVASERLFVPSDGVKGGGKRVWKKFPIVHKWGGTVEFSVLDDKITARVFEDSVRAAFSFIGIGRFRPERGGLYGRAMVKSIKWSEQ